MPKQRLSDEQRDDVARRYVAGETLVELAAAFGVSTTPIVGALKKRGVRVRDPAGVATKHSCDHAYFDILDEPRAYWLGFLFADGCISESTNGTAAPILAIGVARSDGHHVERFREALGSTHKIQLGKAGPNRRFVSTRLSVPSWPLCNALARYGVVPRKSMVAIPPELPAELARHFWRGVFDGNGCLYVPEKRSPSLSVCGSRATVDAFAAWATALLERAVNVYPTGSVWAAAVGGYVGVSRVAAELYKGATVWLGRKRVAGERAIAHAAVRRVSHDRAAMTLNGVTRSVAEWAAVTGHSKTALYQRRSLGWSEEQVLTTPHGKRPG